MSYALASLFFFFATGICILGEAVLPVEEN